VIVYLDSSVLLRVALGQPDVLPEWGQMKRVISSVLIETESLRTLDRLRIRARLSDLEVASRRSKLFTLLDSIEVVDLDERVLGRAGQPMPTELGTLDALHLATAIVWRELNVIKLVFATHDRTLAIAARAHGFKVIGASSGD